MNLGENDHHDGSNRTSGGDGRRGRRSARSGRFAFISYKREDLKHAKLVQGALIAAGYRVWLDETIQSGQQWAREIDEKLKNAGCVVVLWSLTSIKSRWVRHEASVAMGLDTYTPCQIDQVTIDAPFDQLQAALLINWSGEAKHPGLVPLLARVEELLPTFTHRP